MSSHPVVQSRRQLFDYLDSQMNSSYRSILNSRRLENESTQVKTYLLEFDWHLNSHSTKKDESEQICKALTVIGNKKRQEILPHVLNTDEDGFYRVDWTKGKQKIRIYLDTNTDDARRFWIGYSLAPAQEVDRILDILSGSPTSGLDRVWLWPQLLQKIQSWGEFRGVGLDYDHRLFETSQSSELDSTSYLKVQLWGGPETEKVISAITNVREGKVNLSKIRLKYSEEVDQKKFVLEDIKYNGKFTCRGTSFTSHQILLNKLREAYSSKVKEMELHHTVCCSIESGKSIIAGDPISFFPSEPIESLEIFCKVVFAGSAPFHMIGYSQRVEKKFVHVDAVDLHTGSRLFFEIYSDEIRMYLYKGGCGNTIIRFYTNLQRTLNASITSKNTDGQIVF